jgi:hypothetical protein
MAEMRLMVLVFFMNLKSLEFDDRLKDFLQFGSQQSIENWASQQPEGITPTVNDPQADPEKTFDAGAAAFQARMEQTQLNHDDQLKKAELDLTDTIQRMSQLVTNYAMLAGNGSIELVGFPSGTTADSIAEQIDALKTPLKEQYDEVVKLAADDPKKSQEVAETFQEPYNFFFQWSAGMNDNRAPEFNKQWHFPAEEELPTP